MFAQAFAKLPPPEASAPSWLPPVLIAGGLFLLAALLLTAFFMGKASGYFEGCLACMTNAVKNKSRPPQS